MDTKTWRSVQGYNISEAAIVLGISQPTLSRLEAGELWPRAETMAKMIKRSGGMLTVEAIYATHSRLNRKKRSAA